MGCDWYTITHISADGFIVKNVTELDLKRLNEIKSDYIELVIFADCKTNHKENLEVNLFIYDKRTLTKNKISVPGPYEISFTDHKTNIKENFNINLTLTPEILSLQQKFDVRCSNWSIITSMGIGKFGMNNEKTKDFYNFDSLQNFKSYYGYN